jgi:acetyltransferase-like isoleucine patch superfamily enzyme
MWSNWPHITTKAMRAYFYGYYRLKARCLKLVVGDEALADVLYDSLFPDIVLKIGGAKIGQHVRVGRWMTLHESRGSFRKLEVGDDVFIGKHVLIDLSDKVTVGNRCAVGMNTTIITHSNAGDSRLSKEFPPTTKPVEIMDDAQVGWGSVIVKGTRVMKEAMVLPATVASGVLKESCTYGGNPARQIPRGLSRPSHQPSDNLPSEKARAGNHASPVEEQFELTIPGATSTTSNAPRQ